MNIEVNLEEDHEIRLGAHNIKVFFVDPSHEKLDGDHGAYVPKEYSIFINKKDPESIRFTSLIHEILHATEQIFTFELDHFQLNLIAECIGQTLINPEIIKKTKNKKPK